MSESVKEAPAKPEQENGDGTHTEHPNVNVDPEKKEEPQMSSAQAKVVRDNNEGRHTQLTWLIRRSVEEHKSGIKKLTKRQLVAWRDELIHLYDEVKKAHIIYVNGFQDITEDESNMCGAWETQFDTDHTSIIQFTDRYYKPRSTTSTASKSQLSVISSNKTSTVNALAEIAAELKTEMLKMSAESNARLEARLLESNAELDKKIRASNAAILEDFFKRFDEQTTNKIDSARANTFKSVNEQVTQTLKTLSEEIAASNQSTQETFDEIANDSAVLRETVTSMQDNITKQVKASEKILQVKIDKVDAEQRDAATALQNALGQLQTVQKELKKQGQKSSDSTILTAPTATGPSSTFQVTSTPAAKYMSIENTILQRRSLMGGRVSFKGNSEEATSFRPNLTHTVDTTYHLENAPSFERYRPQNEEGDDEEDPPEEGRRRPTTTCCGRQRMPKFTMKSFDGNPKNYARFKARFKVLYHNEYDDDDVRLCILEELLEEKVRNEIGECLTDGSMYPVVWQRLDAVYARPEVMDQKYLNALLELEPLKSTETTPFKTFANKLHGAVVTLQRSKYVDVLASRVTMMVLEAKLPASLKEKWNLKKQRDPEHTSSVLDLDDWISARALSKEENKNVFAALSTSTSKSDPKKPSKDKKGSPIPTATITHVSTSSPVKVATDPSKKEVPAKRGDRTCYVCGEEIHGITKCPVFMALSPTKRAEKVFESSRCLSCLTGMHLRKECKKEFRCNVKDCPKPRHNPLLHGSEFRLPKKSTGPPASSETSVPSAPTVEAYLATATHSEERKRRVLFKIVPVRIRTGDYYFDTFAFLDSGSDTTLLRSDIAKEKLGLSGPRKRVNVKSYDGVVTNVEATDVAFSISSVDEKHVFKVSHAYSIDTLRAASNPPITEAQQGAWPYLRGVVVVNVKPEDVTVLIGIDLPQAHNHETAIEPPDGVIGPMAFETPFGWCLAGKMGPDDEEESPFVSHVATIISEDSSETLNEQVKKFWQLESKDVYVEQPVLSEDDLRGKRILETSIVNIGKRYQVSLMWKSDNVVLPNNRQVALKRLYALEKRFARDAEFAKKYDAVVQEYVNLGHARLLSADEAKTETRKTWYLPHHGVINASSSTTKVRVVFDGAAEFQNTSLNQNLLRGPNLLVSLFGVLLRFRKNLVPVGADIEKMFHQVKVTNEDQAAFRFVYRAPNSRLAPLTYQMTVHVFGAVSSPTTCIFALNKTADDNRKYFPDAAASIQKTFYVDNYLDSFDTEEEVLKRARQLKSLLDLGGFNLTKWISSSREVLAELKQYGLAAPTLDLDLEKLPTERTLGVMWDSESDMFTFKIKHRPESEEIITKRIFLSIITSLYDPLGLVAPVTFLMKSLLQEIWTCRPKVEWDDPLPEELRTRFIRWYNELPKLENLKIPRCFRFQRGKIVTQDLHVFTDASSKGYGAVAYFKTVYGNGFVDISFVMAKTHVTPTKGLTIPRLELQGAVEGLEIAFNVCRELDYDIDKVTFHMDSQTVLRWIYSRTCKFEVFVHNRIGKILRNTSRKQWRFVAGEENPADMCSRGIEPGNFKDLLKFHQGPLFLYYDSSEWNTWPTEESLEPDDCDVNVIRVCSIKLEREENAIDNCVEKFSSLVRIQRVLGWCLRFVHNARAKAKGMELRSGELDVDETGRALALCIKRAQEISFQEEVHCLLKGLELPNRSKLRPFKPFIDGLGQLRVGGRLGNAPVDYAAQYPALLPADQLITHRIIWDQHVRNYHLKTERLLCHLRSRFWIFSGRKTVKSTINKCIPCKRRDVQPVPPIMAPLPKHRLTPFLPAFTYTGVDYFGPLTVTMGGRGRRHEKRWICLFTCLTTRAIHLEVATGLGVNEFLLCFARFKGLRGKPSVIYSDNGTNFVAAERELKEAFEEIRERQGEFKAKLACDQIKWVFSPPHGPHFGGVWERQVQSCKRAMKVTIGNRIVNDQVLNTVAVEVASLLNSRPLTHLSVDPEDPEPLTPNHFLYGGARPYAMLQLVDVKDADVSERQYKQSQAIVEHFWRRWLREYVPNLTERRKWSTERRNVEVGDLVLVIEPNTVRGQWPLGRVIEVLPSSTDNVVRVAKVKIANHLNPCLRPVTKLCVLSTEKATFDVKSEEKSKKLRRVHF